MKFSNLGFLHIAEIDYPIIEKPFVRVFRTPNPNEGNFIRRISLKDICCFIMCMDASICITKHCNDSTFRPHFIFRLNKVIQFWGMQLSLFNLGKCIQRCRIKLRDGLRRKRNSLTILGVSPIIEQKHVSFIVAEKGVSVRH